MSRSRRQRRWVPRGEWLPFDLLTLVQYGYPRHCWRYTYPNGMGLVLTVDSGQRPRRAR